MDKPRIRRVLRSLTIFFLYVLALPISPLASADDAKPRYITGDGEDSSDCRNPFRPCRSLSYTLSQAGKGDPLLVGEGEYQIQDLDQLYTLINADIKAGMDRPSHYTLQSDAVISTLSGVPLEYRDTFEKAGFHVIVDTKGTNIAKTELRQFNQKIQASRSNHSQTDCVAGRAGTFPCQNINLLAHINNSTLKAGAAFASDIWGFVDLNTQREYVIIGLSNGVAVVDISDPASPWVVGTSNGLHSTWRDIKIYQTWDETAGRWHAWAYVSTEANMGLKVLDLGNLPHSFSEGNYVSDFATAHNVYLANVDYSFGVTRAGAEPVLTVAGSNMAGGRYRLYGLTNPATPQLIRSQGAGYMHDAASVQISDTRKDSQCVNAEQTSTCKLLADFNESTVDIWDVTDPDAPVELSSTTYSSASYVHSGWWSEDGQYLFVHDELDESQRSLNTTVRVFSMANLNSPQLVESWVGPTRAIDHNGFVRGNRYYVSNYVEGLTVLDISDPTNLQRIAWFDTEPASTSPVFEGAWGVYPFFPSGTLAVSDINSGLYLLEDNSLATTNGSLAFSQSAWAGTEGETLTIEVQRINGTAGAIAVNVLAHFLNTNSSDASLGASSLNWADGDSAPKTLTLTLNSDALEENEELLVLRLESPSGGASLMQPNLAWVRISDAGTASALSPLHTAVTVSHAQNNILLSVQRKGDVQSTASVDWSLGDLGELSMVETSGSLSWEAGDITAKTVTLSYSSKPEASASFSFNLSNAVNASLEADTVSVQKQAYVPPTTPNPPPGGNNIANNSGGGAAGFVLLCMLLMRVLGAIRPRKLSL